MSEFEEPTLFEHPVLAPVLLWPQLPRRAQWSSYTGGFAEWCDYCVRTSGSVPAGALHRPSWLRVGTEGARLLLCDSHAAAFHRLMGK